MARINPPLTPEQQTLYVSVTRDMILERIRQITKFGAQRELPCITPSLAATVLPEDYAKKMCDDAFAAGNGTWAHIAVEELAEAIGAKTDLERREELIQLATVCMGWIEAIDSRSKT